MADRPGSISICICCNEPLSCRTLKKAILGWAKKRPVQFLVFHDPSSVFRCPQVFDILILGTRFDSGVKGIDAARELRAAGNNAELIFYSGFIEQAIEGYEVDALRFLTKPLQVHKLREALDAALEARRGRNPALMLRSDGSTTIIPVATIAYIKSVARRRIVHAEGKDIPTWETMPNLFARLPIGSFGWVQKGVVVSLEEVHKLNNNIVTMKCGAEFALSRHYKENFHVLLGHYTGAFPAGAAPARQCGNDAS